LEAARGIGKLFLLLLGYPSSSIESFPLQGWWG